MTGLTYRGKPARVDPHLPPSCEPVGFLWRHGAELIPRLAPQGREPDYWVVSAVTAAALRYDARFRRLFGAFSISGNDDLS